MLPVVSVVAVHLLSAPAESELHTSVWRVADKVH